MARFRGSLTTDEVATGTSLVTILQLVAASNHRVVILQWWITFQGVSTTGAPIEVRLLRQTTAGTMSSLTPRALDNSLSETLQTSGQHTATAEPTASDILEQVLVHPQGGHRVVYPFGGEPIVGGGDRLGIDVLAGTGVDCNAGFIFEE